MKVSVIVPVYGVEKYIVKCVDSIVNQTYKNLEILIINDNTKDKSIELIKENFDDDRIIILTKENGGAARARNFGIEHATGDYLFFVDSDDFLDVNCIEDMYNTMIEEKSDFAICDYYKCFEDGRKEHISIIPFYEKNNNKCSVISMPGPVCKLIKRDFFMQSNLRFLPDYYFEDNAIMPLVCALAGTFSYIQEPYYYYLQRNGSALNKSNYDKKWEDIFYVLDYLYDGFVNAGKYDEYKEELEYIYIEYLLHAANLRFLDYSEGIQNIALVSNVMKEKFPKWQKNKYYKKEGIKYKIICNLFYKNKVNLIKTMLRR